MYRTAVLSSLLLLLLPALPAAAADATQPAARAAAVAPLAGSGVSLVVRVDVSRLKPNLLFDMAAQITGDPAAMGAEKVKALAAQAAFLATGAQELYAVVSTDTLPPKAPLLAVPATPKTNAALLGKLLGHGDSLVQVPIGDLVVFAEKDRLASLSKGDPQIAELLTAAFAEASDAEVQAVLVVSQESRRALRETLPELPPEAGGGPSAPLVDGVRWAALGVSLSPQLALHLVVDSPSEDAAKALHAAAPKVIDALARHPEVARVFPLEKAKGAFDVERKGIRTHLRLKGDAGGALLASVLEPPVAAARESARRAQALNQFKQIAIAMHNYADVHKTLPPAYSAKDGKPLLSWRVHILPYIEQDALYREFHLDEPWDSDHNQKLIARMPKLYALPGSKAADENRTVIFGPRGESTVFTGSQGVPFSDILDGTSNTILLIEGDELHATPWTKPDDWQLDEKAPLAGVGGHFQKVFTVAMSDGSCRYFSLDIDPQMFRALLTRRGQEAVQIP